MGDWREVRVGDWREVGGLERGGGGLERGGGGRGRAERLGDKT